MKRFLTIKEQMDLLSSERGLLIDDKHRFEYYLQSYNFHNMIKRYETFFCVRTDGKAQYNEGISSEDVIDLFNFDRAIAHTILPSILNIERRICTAVAYVICDAFSHTNNKNHIKELENGMIMNTSNKDFNFIFPRLKPDQINDFKFELVKHTIKSNRLKFEYNVNDDRNVRNIPIWELSINWTFNTIIAILINIRKELKTKIIKHYFQKEKIHDCILDNFVSIITLLNVVKNRTYHNNPIFDIDVKNNRENINRFIDFLQLRDKKYLNSNSIRLYDIVEIVDYLWHKRDNSLTKAITIWLKECIKHKKIRKETWRNCLSYMKFYAFVL